MRTTLYVATENTLILSHGSWDLYDFIIHMGLFNRHQFDTNFIYSTRVNENNLLLIIVEAISFFAERNLIKIG